MSLIFSGEPGSSDPTDAELTPEWLARWEVLSSRLAAAAAAHGGSTARDGFEVSLHPPRRGQSLIKVSILGPRSALIEVKHVKLPVNWELDDNNPNATLEQTVYTIMENDIWIQSEIRIADDDQKDSLGAVGIRQSAWS